MTESMRSWTMMHDGEHDIAGPDCMTESKRSWARLHDGEHEKLGQTV